MKLIVRKWKILILLSALSTVAVEVFAGEMVYFKTYEGQEFACDRTNLDRNLDQENGKLAAICSFLAQPGVEDGESEKSPFKLDVDGKLFQKYILNIFRYGKVAFKNKSDAENTLSICEDLGLPLAEDYICTQVLKRKPRQSRSSLVGLNSTRGSAFLRDTSELDELLGHFVGIRGGKFQMGSPAEEEFRQVNETQHSVTLSSFELGEAAVTQETYAKIMGTNPSRFVGQNFCPGSFKDVEGPGGQQISVCADHPV
ncbi:MAG: SUMF1/EgtB/PvdO family nonheme iron enzyme, partial [Bdellovibrionia bacterium]